MNNINKCLILYLEKSGVTSVSVKAERPELPRVLDVVFANLELMRANRSIAGSLRHLVLDFAHAFFNFPGRPDERKYFTTRLGESIRVWWRTAQGSRGAPLVCGRALALAMRLAAATVEGSAMSASTYVDDPIASFIGDDDQQDDNMCLVVAALLAFGYDLAFNKAQDSKVERNVTWTSAILTILTAEPGIKVEVKAEIISDLSESIADIYKANAVSIDVLRSLAGKATCVSSLVHVWRPFVSMLWAPIYDRRSRCHFDQLKVWRRAIDIPLRWMDAFLRGTMGTLQRTYTLASYLHEGDKYSIVVDASPWGLGAYLQINGVISEYAFGPVTSDDEAILGIKAGGSEGQQCWEALVVLAALRLWSSMWRERRITLEVKGDSVTALTMLIKMKADGWGTSVIAREVALDIAEALYEPMVGAHVPGISNIIADTLSRPEKIEKHLPPALAHARRRYLPDRPRLWWRSL